MSDRSALALVRGLLALGFTLLVVAVTSGLGPWLTPLLAGVGVLCLFVALGLGTLAAIGRMMINDRK